MIRVIHIIISRQSTENRLAQKPDQRMQQVLASSRIPQQSASNVVQAQDFIQLPEQQQTAVRTDL